MAMKIDQASSIDPRPPQITISASPKVSKFGMKTGFVIPKNKLSGSLVPVYRGTAKTETDTVKEETAKQNQRKTKWGMDLTQDASVRKGRALAYQTRVEQITKQLKAGVLEKGDEYITSQSPDAVQKDKSSNAQADDQSQELEMLELEKREVIGQILKLNPSYKAPLDYKPLMKETSIPVPVKLYPSLNFVSLILGPGNDTQKRLEEETGARIRIKGTKAGSAEKVEITSSDKNDVQDTYEELYVHVLADTFEKVDSAVSLIELLVTPVSANSVTVSAAPSTDSLNGPEQSQPNQGVMQPMVRPMQPLFIPQGQFHPYPAPSQSHTPPWFQSGPNSTRPHNNFGPQPNNLMPNNVGPFSSSPQNPSRPQFYNGPRNPPQVSPRLHPPPQNYQWPPQNNQGPPPRMHPMSGPPQPHLTYPGPPFHGQPNNPPMTHQNTNNQPRITGPGPGPGQGPGFFPSSQTYPTPPIGNNNMNSPSNFPPRPSNHTVTNPNFSFVVHQRSPLPPPNPVPQPLPVASPSTTTPLLRPSSSDFTFRPLGSPLGVPIPNNQAPPQQPPPQLQTPPFRPPQPQFGPPQPQTSSLPFPGNQPPNRPTQRFPEFANQVGPPPTRIQLPPQPQPQPQMANFHGRYPPQMMNPQPPPLHHNQSGPMMRPGGGTFVVPNQQYGNNPAFATGRPVLSPGGNQVYDPFSPTSANPPKIKKQENDPEYDDLMASVGVR